MPVSACVSRRLVVFVGFQWILSLLSAADPFAAPVLQEPTAIPAKQLVSAQWVVFRQSITEFNAVQPTVDCIVLSRAEADALRRNVLLTNKQSRASEVSMLKFMHGHTATLTDSRLNLPDTSALNSVTITVGGVEQEFTTRVVGVEVELSGEPDSDGQVRVQAKIKQTQFMGFKEHQGRSSEIPIPGGFYLPIFETWESERAFTLTDDKVAVLQFREKRLFSTDYRRLGIPLSWFPLARLERGEFKMPEPEASLLLIFLSPPPEAEPTK